MCPVINIYDRWQFSWIYVTPSCFTLLSFRDFANHVYDKLSELFEKDCLSYSYYFNNWENFGSLFYWQLTSLISSTFRAYSSYYMIELFLLETFDEFWDIFFHRVLLYLTFRFHSHWSLLYICIKETKCVRFILHYLTNVNYKHISGFPVEILFNCVRLMLIAKMPNQTMLDSGCIGDRMDSFFSN